MEGRIKGKKITGNSENVLQRIVTNFKGLVRHDQMEGKDYLVVPMIMLTEGVHIGTNGPLYYPKEEISKIPEVWNTKPVIVYHPAAGASACTPEILTNRRIGVIMNSIVKEGLAGDGKTKVVQLHAEAWLEEDRVKKVDERVMEAIENEEVMELSTGLFTDNEEVEGEWNGEAYEAIAHNYRPDHLALLPDLVGACSVADGAGFLRLNAEKQENRIPDSFAKDYFPFLDAAGIDTSKLVPNELSYGQLRNELYAYLKDKVSGNAWVEEVFDDFFIYNLNENLFKLAYSVDKDDVVKTQGIPEEVFRVIQYRNLKGKVLVGNVIKNYRKEQKMTKKEIVNGIIENEANQFGEDDREVLMATDEDMLGKMVPVANEEKGEEKVKDNKSNENDNKGNESEEKDKGKSDEDLSDNEDKTKVENVQTVDEYVSNAPEDIQQVLRSSVNAYKATKNRVIDVLIANKKNTFTKEDLQRKDLSELRSLLALAGDVAKKGSDNPALNFEGQGNVLDNEEITDEEPLEVPTMNFEAKS